MPIPPRPIPRRPAPAPGTRLGPAATRKTSASLTPPSDVDLAALLALLPARPSSSTPARGLVVLPFGAPRAPGSRGAAPAPGSTSEAAAAAAPDAAVVAIDALPPGRAVRTTTARALGYDFVPCPAAGVVALPDDGGAGRAGGAGIAGEAGAGNAGVVDDEDEDEDEDDDDGWERLDLAPDDNDDDDLIVVGELELDGVPADVVSAGAVKAGQAAAKATGMTIGARRGRDVPGRQSYAAVTRTAGV